MKTISTNIFTDEDIELLKTPLPKDPCTTCGIEIVCCGCPKGSEYGEIIRPYKQAGIYELACKLKTREYRLKEIKACEKEIEEIEKEFPEDIKKLLF